MRMLMQLVRKVFFFLDPSIMKMSEDMRPEEHLVGSVAVTVSHPVTSPSP